MKATLLKFFCLILLLGSFTTLVPAQGFYIGVNAGYALKLSAESQVQMTIDGTTHSYKTQNYSLGNGFDAGLMIGYMLNANIGAELTASYLIGGKTTIKDEKLNGGSTWSHEYIQNARMLRLNPCVVVAAGFERIDPYAKLGIIIGFGSITHQFTAIQDEDKLVEKRKDKGGIALGMSAALGVNYKLNEKFALFAEINMENMSYSPTKGVMTEVTENGVDQLPTMDTNEKEFEYITEYTETKTEPSSEPAKSPKIKYPFGAIGLNIGVKLKL